MFKLISAISFLLTFCIHSSLGRMNGAPIDACEEMMPHHFVEDAALPLPYQVSLDKTHVLGNETLRITLETKEGGRPAFKGFLIQAREVGATVFIPQGYFNTAVSVNDTKQLDCEELTASTMTHRHNFDKTKVEFEWIPPNTNGTFEIIMTVVEKFETCWTKGWSSQVGVTQVESSASQFALIAPLLIITLIKCLF